MTKIKEPTKKIDFKHNLKEYFSLLGKHKFIFMLLIFTILIFEGLTLANSLFFKKVIDNGTLFLAGELAKNVFVQILIVIAVAFAAVAIIRVFAQWMKIYLSIIIDSDLVSDLKKRYFRHILSLSHKFHTTHKTGSLISRLSRGARAIEDFTDILAYNFAPLIMQLFIVGFSVSYFNLSTGLTVLIMATSFILYSLFIQKKQEPYKLEYNKAEDNEKGIVSDVFTNVDSIKYFGKEKRICNLFADKVSKTKYWSIKNWGFHKWFYSGQILILALGTFFIMFFSLRSFLAGNLTLGELTFIYTIYGNIIGPMYMFVHGLMGFYRYIADFQDLFEYGKIKNDIKDKKDAKKLKIEKGSIEFNDIDFTYGKKNLFENFNLKIKPNEKIALVGQSGCGKSSLVKLLYRFYDLDKGEILIDGKRIRDVKQESLRSEMSIVPQECILFDDTIYNNILFARPGATREEVIAAIRFAQLDKVIANFDEKEKTIVGERGVKLSGGEKQRVSIARAILADKKILVLDEATSALDSETEHEIQKDLQELLKGRTSIIIAHRLSTIMSADRIIVMDNGKIIEMGNHNQLLRLHGKYAKLWRLQKSGFIR